MYFEVNMLWQFNQQTNDGGQITAIRIGDWKAVFLEHAILETAEKDSLSKYFLVRQSNSISQFIQNSES